MLIGYLRDATGSYRIGFSLLIVIALAGAAAVAALPRPAARALVEPS
jgi:cyanate permease